MIDFTTIKDAAGWASTAQALIATARDAAKNRDMGAMKQASSDLLAFLQNRTSDCPAAVSDAVLGAQSEVNLAITSTAVGDIDQATTQLAAFAIDVQRVSADLNQKAKLIELQPVIDTLNSVTNLVDQAKSLQTKLRGATPGAIDVAGLQTDVSAIIDQLSNVVSGLKQATGQA